MWVFSAQTVDNIENLYEQYHPAEFERYLPTWLKLQVFGIALWEFLSLILFFLLTMGVGWILSKGAEKIISRYVDDEKYSRYAGSTKGVADLVSKLTVPLTFTISFSLVFTLVSGGFPYLDAVASSIRPLIWIGLVFSAMWLGIRVINFFANRYQDMQIENLAEEHFDKVRRRRTYVSIFRRVFIFVMVLGSIWIGLSEFANMEGLGKTLLTSAGIAGVVIGIAAQPILGNIIAGVQVAVTQPVRIGDSVIMDGNFSTVEDLRYTYAVLKTWDERRLIVPMRELITEKVENWSHTEVHQTCPVFLYIDYGADIEAIRQQFISVTKDNELWDNKTEPVVFVVEVNENTIQLRGAVASVGPIEAWTLACEVREQMLGYLHEQQNKPMDGANRIVKRIEDIILATLILALISIPMLMIAFCVRMTSPGPALFRQKRYGIDGKSIEVWKFRSMKVMENGAKVTQATRGDNRITPFGAFLRRTSLDELPQFINVLRGEMSIVGPRPHAIAHNEEYRKIISGYMLRHKVKPGITGWAQINGWRGETDTVDKMEKRIEYDLDYIRNWSLFLDLKIVFLTVFKGFINKNAY